MAKVCFFFEPVTVDVFSGHDVILDAWNYAIKAAGDIDEVAIIDSTFGGAVQFDQDLATTIYTGIEQWHPTGTVAVIDTPWNTDNGVPLWSFNHAVDWYCFGPAAGWAGRTQSSLYIPQAGQGALHAVHVASVVMLHRYATVGGA